jgi:hypothetical protein
MAHILMKLYEMCYSLSVLEVVVIVAFHIQFYCLIVTPPTMTEECFY